MCACFLTSGAHQVFLTHKHWRSEGMAASCLQSIRKVDAVQHKSKDAEQEPDFQDLLPYLSKVSPGSVEDQADLRKCRNDRVKYIQLPAGCTASSPASCLPVCCPTAAEEFPFLGEGIRGRSSECGQDSAGVASHVLPGAWFVSHAVNVWMLERGRPAGQVRVSYAKHLFMQWKCPDSVRLLSLSRLGSW